jgi:hypothetical protein
MILILKILVKIGRMLSARQQQEGSSIVKPGSENQGMITFAS